MFHQLGHRRLDYNTIFTASDTSFRNQHILNVVFFVWVIVPNYTTVSGNDRFRISEYVTSNGNEYGLQIGHNQGTGILRCNRTTTPIHLGNMLMVTVSYSNRTEGGAAWERIARKLSRTLANYLELVGRILLFLRQTWGHLQFLLQNLPIYG